MKRILTLVLFLLASTPIIHAQTQKGYRDAKVESELIELVRKWDTASVNNDAATLDNLLAEEFTLSGVTKKAYLEFTKSPTTILSADHRKH